MEALNQATADSGTADLRRFGRYTLFYRVAQGGMASVYLAQLRSNEYFEKWVAVKVIHPKMAADPKFVSMFMTEARLVARLDHPHICTVFDFGESEGTYFLAMEYLDGVPLNAMFDRAFRDGGRMPLGLASRIIADAARGLHAAHELRSPDGTNAGVVHRDVSPHNVFVLFGGLSKVVDFGVARTTDRSIGELTTGIEVKGKLQYMSPEQLRGDPLDRRADVFALGIVLWELSTGRRLFKRSRDMDTIVAVLKDPIAPPSSVLPDYPAKLERIVMKALARNAAERYATAADMARDLEDFIASTGVAAGHGQVADFMEKLFADTVERHTELLQRARDLAASAPAQIETFSFQSGIEMVGTSPGSSPSARSRVAANIPSAAPPPETTEDASAVSIEAQRTGGRALATTGLLALAAAGALAFGVARGFVHLPGSSSATAPPAPTHAALAPTPPSSTPTNAPSANAAPANTEPGSAPTANAVPAGTAAGETPEAPEPAHRVAGRPGAAPRRAPPPPVRRAAGGAAAPATPSPSPSPAPSRRGGAPSPMTEFE